MNGKGRSSVSSQDMILIFLIYDQVRVSFQLTSDEIIIVNSLNVLHEQAVNWITLHLKNAETQSEM